MTAANLEDDDSGSPGRWQLPHDEAAERAVLGAAMLSRRAVADVAAVVHGPDFYRPAHELIWAAVVALDGDGKPAEAQLVADELRKRGELERVGGAAYLHVLLSSVVNAASASYYALIVREKAVLRRLVQAGARIQALGHAVDGGDVSELVAEAVKEVEEAASAGVRAPAGVSFAERFEDLLSELDEPRADGAGISWGSRDMDGLLNPMRPGQLIVAGARPRVGKSSWARTVAVDAAVRQGKRVLIHSFEMSRTECEEAILSTLARVPFDRISSHTCTADDHLRLDRVRALVDGAVLVIDDSASMTTTDLEASVRRWRPDLVIVDQLQHLHPPPSRRVNSRQEEVGAVSRALKTMAQREQAAVFACSKLNRRSELANTAPTMADLRDSGEIESDADTIVLIHREELADRDSPRVGEADFIVAKQRAGRTGVVTLASQMHYQTFVDMAGDL